MNTQKSAGRNICSVEEVQTYIDNSNTSLTGFIQSCVSSVSMQFENYCNRGLKLNTYTDYYDGDGSNILYLNQFPVISISALQYQTSPTSSFVDIYDSSLSANILISNAGNIMLYDKSFLVGINNIKVIYIGGYSDCPFDLKKIAIEATAEMFAESKQGGSRLGINTTSINEGNSYGESYTKLWEQHKVILNKYKRNCV